MYRSYLPVHHGPFACHFYPYYPTYPQGRCNMRQFPEVDPSLFMTSAHHMQAIMRDASKLLDIMARSRKFSYDLMDAAQKSDKGKVNTLIQGTGIQTIPSVSYNPDGLRLQFQGKPEHIQLILTLRWR